MRKNTTEPQYVVRNGQLQVVQQEEVIFTETVRVDSKGNFIEIVVRPDQEGEVRIPVSSILGDGSFTPSDFTASEKLASVTGNVGI